MNEATRGILRDEVITQLFAQQDIKYRAFHSKLCPGLENIIGVRMPVLRKIAKKIIQSDYRQFLKEVKDEYHEETLLAGLVIAEAKMGWDKRQSYLRDFVPKLDNWAACDLVCASFKLSPPEIAPAWEYVLSYQTSTGEYERRFMLVMMMDHFLLPEYLPRIFAIVNSLETEQYYVNMAIAWLVSVAFVKYRSETLEFLKRDSLNAFTHNKAIQKIRESYRVTKSDKALVASLKR